jgi:hypothetical protein
MSRRLPLLVLSRSFSVVRGGRKPPAAATKAVATVPDEWSPVVDKKSGLTYYWHQRSGRTTALGELPPDARAAAPPFVQRPTSFARTMVEMTAWGAGVALAVSAVRAVIG